MSIRRRGLTDFVFAFSAGRITTSCTRKRNRMSMPVALVLMLASLLLALPLTAFCVGHWPSPDWIRGPMLIQFALVIFALFAIARQQVGSTVVEVLALGTLFVPFVWSWLVTSDNPIDLVTPAKQVRRFAATTKSSLTKRMKWCPRLYSCSTASEI